ncbi:hypothetical protein BC828DRAFT_380181 [Blastocladiella britannica]|nr:hypothetical protein BC828DRAFT_380181 [Blastocladiella britannica]
MMSSPRDRDRPALKPIDDHPLPTEYDPSRFAATAVAGAAAPTSPGGTAAAASAAGQPSSAAGAAPRAGNGGASYAPNLHNASSGPHGPTADTMTLRALLTTKEAGIVIGKGGANIKAIRDESNARIQVSEHLPGVGERVLSAVGAIEEVAKAFAQIGRNLNAGSLRATGPGAGLPGALAAAGGGPGNALQAIESTPLTLRILIPNSRMGAVIGKAGARIKEIQDESNARLLAQPQCLLNSQERVLEMIGVPDAIHIATYHMLVTLKDFADRPCNDRQYRPEHGLLGNPGAGMHNGGHAGGYGMQGHGHGGHGGGGGGGNMYGLPNNPAHGYGGGGGGYGGGGGGMGGPGAGYYGGGGPVMGGPAPYYPNAGMSGGGGGGGDSKTFMCPVEKVGHLIGKQGAKINRIRAETSTRINLEPHLPGAESRAFVVLGHPRDVDAALRMLETSLRRELQRDQVPGAANGAVGTGFAPPAPGGMII